jgi:hypothetical protein
VNARTKETEGVSKAASESATKGVKGKQPIGKGRRKDPGLTDRKRC